MMQDPDEFTEVIQPLAPGAKIWAPGDDFSIQMTAAPIDRFSLFRAAAPHIEGMMAEAEDFFSLTIPIRDGFDAGRDNPHTEFSGSRVYVQVRGMPFRFRFGEATEVMVLGFKQPIIDDFTSALNADLVDNASLPINAMSMDTTAGAMLRRYLNYVWDETVNRNVPEFEKVVQTLEPALLTMTALAINAGGHPVLLPERDAPDDAVKRAADYIAEYYTEPLSLAEISRASTVPVRSLTRAFRARYGVSPMNMVRDRRLEAVHKMLSVSEPGQLTVTEAAMDAGFGHLGRFTALYRERFGELPSQTLSERIHIR